MNVGIAIEPAGGMNMDRAAAFVVPSGTVLVLADGAGGASGGGEAASRVIAFVAERARDLATSAGGYTVASMLRSADLAVRAAPDCGETTAVVAVVVDDRVFGASVGDSEAWIVDDGRIVVLTEDQRRRPFIGAGAADPVLFGPVAITPGRLILGSDGLFKYVSRKRILETLSVGGSAESLATALASAAQLPSGRYSDDVSVIVCSDA